MDARTASLKNLHAKVTALANAYRAAAEHPALQDHAEGFLEQAEIWAKHAEHVDGVAAASERAAAG